MKLSFVLAGRVLQFAPHVGLGLTVGKQRAVLTRVNRVILNTSIRLGFLGVPFCAIRGMETERCVEKNTGKTLHEGFYLREVLKNSNV